MNQRYVAPRDSVNQQQSTKVSIVVGVQKIEFAQIFQISPLSILGYSHRFWGFGTQSCGIDTRTANPQDTTTLLDADCLLRLPSINQLVAYRSSGAKKAKAFFSGSLSDYSRKP